MNNGSGRKSAINGFSVDHENILLNRYNKQYMNGENLKIVQIGRKRCPLELRCKHLDLVFYCDTRREIAELVELLATNGIAWSIDRSCGRKINNQSSGLIR